MSIRLIVSDIDGTLVGRDGVLSKYTKETLLECERRGIDVVLASGRTFYGARIISSEAGLKSPIISANGGRADRDGNGEAIFEDVLTPEMSLKVYHTLKSAGCFMTSYVGKYVYMVNETNGYGSNCMSRSEAMHGGEHIIFDDAKRMEEEGTIAPYKYEAYSDDESLMNKLRETFLSWGLSVSSAFPYNLEIMAPGAGKARAIKAIADMKGIAREEIMALGDGSNDIGMIEYAGLGVAMGNAVDVLKLASDLIAPNQNEDGAAQIIRKYALMEEKV
ncbi:MAG: HAD family phosphatase [Clostridia bacterium]|nr:HAD family phosphatase [Clostridia bacterium]